MADDPEDSTDRVSLVAQLTILAAQTQMPPDQAAILRRIAADPRIARVWQEVTRTGGKWSPGRLVHSIRPLDPKGARDPSRIAPFNPGDIAQWKRASGNHPERLPPTVRGLAFAYLLVTAAELAALPATTNGPTRAELRRLTARFLAWHNTTFFGSPLYRSVSTILSIALDEPTPWASVQAAGHLRARDRHPKSAKRRRDWFERRGLSWTLPQLGGR